MAVLTESKLRTKWKNEKFKEYIAGKDEVITPSAREFLKEKGVVLIFGQDPTKKEPQAIHKVPHPVHEREATSNTPEDPKKYKNYYTGEYYSKKPEAMTQLYANLLVYKDDPRIEFRGRVDSLEAEFLRGMLLLKH